LGKKTKKWKKLPFRN